MGIRSFLVWLLTLCSLGLVGFCEQAGPYTYVVTNGAATIVGFDRAYTGEVQITNSLGGYPVTTIGDKAFELCTKLLSLTFPDSVTNVGNQAFSFCTGLTNVSIGAGVTMFGQRAFEGCEKLLAIGVSTNNPAFCSISGVMFDKSATALVRYPAGRGGAYIVPSTVTRIGERAMERSRKLSSITLPESVTSVEEGAFLYCSGLKNVALPSGVTTVAPMTFYFCTGLTNAVLPSGLSSIGAMAFEGCTRLAGIAFPGSVTNIGELAFLYCSDLTEVTLPPSVSYIAEGAFAGCDNLLAIYVDPANSAYTSREGVLFDSTQTVLVQYPAGKGSSYRVPTGTTTLAPYSFGFATALTQIDLPEELTQIGAHAFYNCPALTAINIPAAVTSIGDEAFARCGTALRCVYFAGDAPTPGNKLFDSSYYVTVYYLPARLGWGDTYAERPAVLWNPAFTMCGWSAGTIHFAVEGTSDIPVALETSSNLLEKTWLRICTTNLTSGSASFSVPVAPADQAFFYRITGP